MNACILICFFAVVIMCHADPNSLELNSLESLNRRLQNPLLHNLLQKKQVLGEHSKVARQLQANSVPLHDLRRFGYVPGYGVAGLGAGIGAGAGLNAGLSAGIDAGVSAAIGGSVGAGIGGYGYGGLGYPYYG